MTEEQKLKLLLKVLKQYAESRHCYEDDGVDEDFESGANYGEILFARTLLEQIGVEFEYPVMKRREI